MQITEIVSVTKTLHLRTHYFFCFFFFLTLPLSPTRLSCSFLFFLLSYCNGYVSNDVCTFCNVLAFVRRRTHLKFFCMWTLLFFPIFLLGQGFEVAIEDLSKRFSLVQLLPRCAVVIIPKHRRRHRFTLHTIFFSTFILSFRSQFSHPFPLLCVFSAEMMMRERKKKKTLVKLLSFSHLSL